jgi:hypothetical protein
MPRGALPSIMLIPAGPAWPAVLALAADYPAASHEEAMLFLGLAEDWAGGVSVWTPDPVGAADAGRLVVQVLPRFVHSYRHDESRKRVLRTMLTIPHYVPGFAALMERACTPQSEDSVARELSELVATTLWSALACRAIPDAVIDVVRARLLMVEASRETGWGSAVEVDSSFGIHDRGVTEFFPASAIQGPFHALLREHPSKGLDFILELLNHAGAWYGDRRWPGFHLEPAVRVTLDVPGTGPVEQWMNDRLYLLHRGHSVGPEVLKSALMALEAWLLRRAQQTDDDLEPMLLDMLGRSNNVMVTGVVASICVAAPTRVGRAPLALLSCPEVVLADRGRMARDSMGPQATLRGLTDHAVHDDERTISGALPHRRDDLEQLALRLQQTALRDEVWALIDWHRAEVGDHGEGDGDGNEDSRIWRLALHRMDLRSYRVVEPPSGAATHTDGVQQLLYAEPALEPDLREMVDASVTGLASVHRYLRLINAGHKLWENRTAPEAAHWRTFLAEARALALEGPAPEPHLAGFASAISAVCLRDHRTALDDDERAWCVQQVQAELTDGADASDDFTLRSLGGGNGPAAVAALIVAHASDALTGNAETFLAMTLTHAASNVVDVAYRGAAAFLGVEHRALLLRCAAAAAMAMQAADNAREAARREQRRAGLGTRSVAAAARAAAAAALRLDEHAASLALATLDFDRWTGTQAAVRIALLLEQRPEWPEAAAFFLRIATWLADVWDDRPAGRGAPGRAQRERHYEAEAALTDILARFVLRQAPGAARATCARFIPHVHNDTGEVASFVRDLISAADQSSDDSFWEVWQLFADAIAAAPWTNDLQGERPSDTSLIDAIFLGAPWRRVVRHWDRLDGHETRMSALSRQLPAARRCACAFLRYLFTIGQRSLPQSFIQLHDVVARGDATAILMHGDSAYLLETLLGRYIYAQPHRLKSDRALRDAVLALLNGLVETGSSAAYRMRDDFVTPPPRSESSNDGGEVA